MARVLYFLSRQHLLCMLSGESKMADFQNQSSEVIPLNIVKQMMEVQEKSFRSLVKVMIESFNERLDGVIKDVQKIKDSLEFSQREIDNLKVSTTRVQESVPRLEEQVSTLQMDLNYLDDNQDYLENQSRRSNLWLDGVPEVPNETWEKTEEVVKGITQEKLQLDSTNIEIERAHHTGRKVSGKPRQIVAKFLRYKDKDILLKSTRRQKGTGIYINEDFSNRTMQRCRDQYDEMMSARRSWKLAYFKVDKLIIKDRQPAAAASSTQKYIWIWVSSACVITINLSL